MSPYALAGGGALMFYPSSSEFNTNPLVGNQTRGAFLYGAGANFPMTKHLSLRAEYRGFLYNTPHYGLGILQPATLTHTAQPSLGIAYRF